MQNPEEEYITFDPDFEQVIRWENVDGAEDFADKVADSVWVQEVESDDLDTTFDTFGRE